MSTIPNYKLLKEEFVLRPLWVELRYTSVAFEEELLNGLHACLILEWRSETFLLPPFRNPSPPRAMCGPRAAEAQAMVLPSLVTLWKHCPEDAVRGPLCPSSPKGLEAEVPLKWDRSSVWQFEMGDCELRGGKHSHLSAVGGRLLLPG